MFSWLGNQFLTEMWPWFTTGVLAILGLIGAAWVFPKYRPMLIGWAAGVLAIVVWAADIYRKGRASKQREWDRANEKAIQDAREARERAERDVAGGVRDPYQRD